MPLPQQAVQACHAVIEAGRHALFPPADEHPHLVLCGLHSELALEGVIARLVRLAIAHRTFFEPDLSGQLTAVCTGPLRGPQRRALRRYSLWAQAPHTIHLPIAEDNDHDN